MKKIFCVALMLIMAMALLPGCYQTGKVAGKAVSGVEQGATDVKDGVQEGAHDLKKGYEDGKSN